MKGLSRGEYDLLTGPFQELVYREVKPIADRLEERGLVTSQIVWTGDYDYSVGGVPTYIKWKRTPLCQLLMPAFAEALRMQGLL